MIHFRKIIFDLLDKSWSNEDIKDFVHKNHGMELTMPRINNYRDLHEKIKLNAVERQKFLDGKTDLLGNPI